MVSHLGIPGENTMNNGKARRPRYRLAVPLVSGLLFYIGPCGTGIETLLPELFAPSATSSPGDSLTLCNESLTFCVTGEL